MSEAVEAIRWEGDVLYLLDQRLLPTTTDYLRLTDARAAAEAIASMVVRGAPAIGITAAYGVVLSVLEHQYKPDARVLVEQDMETLAASRPTAINLFWALDCMRKLLDEGDLDPDRFRELAMDIHERDIADNRRMGELGAALLPDHGSVLTHCNAGALATGGYGTALGVIRSAHKQGKIERVYADETRPWLQGSRLTAWEMIEEGIPVSLVADGAAAQLLKSGQVSWVIVGSDRIAANGDVANKIGTYSAAIAARYHGLKFMVVAPTSTIDMNVASGDEIPIETRDADELLGCSGHRVAASGAEAWNPVFDVTPAELVDVIVTEKGVVEQPTAAKMKALMES